MKSNITNTIASQELDTPTTMLVNPSPRRRRRRRPSENKRNNEDIEKQRMSHIAIERNRRKQMNHYLSVLQQLIPESYVQRSDQASIVGGAINYVKELEQQLQLLSGQKQFEGASCGPFHEFFTFPQYSSIHQNLKSDIEVTMVETHAYLKIRSQRRSKQLWKMLSGLQTLRLTILHLNVTTVDQIVLYCLSVKVEDDCKLTSVDEIATAVHQILCKIQQEASN